MIAVVNRIINEKGELLILLRATRPFGWGLAGGKVDDPVGVGHPGESYWQACIRETKEETGIELTESQMTYIGPSVSATGIPVEVFETVLDHTPVVNINKREHLNKRWVKIHRGEYAGVYNAEVYQLKFAGKTLDFIDLGRPHFIPDFLLK